MYTFQPHFLFCKMRLILRLLELGRELIEGTQQMLAAANIYHQHLFSFHNFKRNIL